MTLPLDPRERAFARFDGERPAGHGHLSGWERTCFIRGWDEAEKQWQKLTLFGRLKWAFSKTISRTAE